MENKFVGTPIANRVKETKHFTVPATPNLERLGYGTGVGVFSVDRSPRNGQLSSPWALKKLMRGTYGSKLIAQRLKNEADILKDLNHPNIVGFRAFVNTSDGRGCLAMEKCQTSLGDLIEQCREEELVIPVANMRKVAAEVAKALDYIHNTVYILHGDIKSHNILIKGDFDEIKVCDFGVCLPLTPEGTLKQKVTGKKANVYIGTKVWSAPEVLEERTTDIVITDKADIFSYGLVIWEMLTRQPPHISQILEDSETSFDEDAYNDQLDALIGTKPLVPEFISDAVECQDLVQLFHKCAEEDYKLRYSANEVLQFCDTRNFVE